VIRGEGPQGGDRPSYRLLLKGMVILEAPLLALSVFFILATGLPFIRSDEWWIRMFDFPRAQIALGGLCTAGLFLWVGDSNSGVGKGVLTLLVLCVLYQGYRMYPYTFLASQQVLASTAHRRDSSFSLLISNVLRENRNVAKYVEIIRAADPDLLLAVETDQWWTAQLGVLDDAYRYTVQYPLDNCYGMLVYSRLKLIHPEIKFLVEDDIPSIHTGVELRSGDRIGLHCLHPRPPHPPTDQDATERDAELLIVGRAVKEADEPALVVGDLNDVAWSDTTSLFQKISGLLDPRIGRGLYNTFDANNPLFRWPLDHVFHSSHFKLIRLKRLSSFGSDHFPVYIELSYEPEAQAQQSQPAADQEEREEAEEKIEKAEQKEQV
jgi:endonuclease/exonuclease/phosphatase (EEP) superfamily protein YafD